MSDKVTPITTDRLLVRPLVATDLDAVFGILGCKRTCGGRVFGSKAALASTEIALRRLDHVTATIRNTKVASLRVAAKAGLKPSRQSFSDDPELLSFASD
ncbi:hypothetical protein [Octadecabacter antarcticus]|uniref:hypothetical protein n=1 Tax=Octadecabacter antarcticus TaxID=1217908 RepID=UPI0005C480C8|nr:hypothetical protein [Octadecabacter antarcticus]